MEQNHTVNRGFKIFIFLSFTLIALLFYAPPVLAAETGNSQKQVTLDAERVSYNDEAGKAAAEGDAVLTYEGATIRADRIDYDAVSQKVKASPANPEGSVSLEGMGRKLTGSSLEYDLNTQVGVLNGARSDMPVGAGTLYITGGEMQFMPYEQALSRGLVRGRAESGDGGPTYAGFAEKVTATTCALDHPHYRIESKSIVFIPGQLVIARKPRLYLGDAFIFTYPMDYVARIDRRALSHNIVPYIEDSEEKGTGIGMSGGLEWDTGSVSLGAAYWTDTGAEWMLGVEQSLGGGFSIESGVEYIWSEAWDEKQYTQNAALRYQRNGWEAAVRGVWKEYVEVQKDANNEYRGRLDRKPEFTVLTPWLDNPAWKQSWFRFGAVAGNYWERTPSRSYGTVTRYGLTMNHYMEYPLGRDENVTFFSNLLYGAWFYDKDGSDQEIADGIIGFRYNLGTVELASGYQRRYVWGESPMSWDDYSERERLHQKIRFPLGKEWYLAVRGSYDMDESKIDEMYYAIQWINDCMKWELRFRDDRTSGSNTSIGFSVSILAYPNTPLSFGQSEIYDPFEAPDVPR